MIFHCRICFCQTPPPPPKKKKAFSFRFSTAGKGFCFLHNYFFIHFVKFVFWSVSLFLSKTNLCLVHNLRASVVQCKCVCVGGGGGVRIPSWYSKFNGSHFGLSPTSIVWTMTHAHRPQLPALLSLSQILLVACPLSRISLAFALSEYTTNTHQEESVNRLNFYFLKQSITLSSKMKTGRWFFHEFIKAMNNLAFFWKKSFVSNWLYQCFSVWPNPLRCSPSKGQQSMKKVDKHCDACKSIFTRFLVKRQERKLRRNRSFHQASSPKERKQSISPWCSQSIY